MLGVRNINRSLTEREIETLRNEIQRFTVRRTKKVLNGLIEREPEHYVDKDGRQCRFPRHKPMVYTLDEPGNDRELAQQIRDLADQLVGATHFVQTIEMPEILRQQGMSEQSFLQGRLNSAKKLARYVVTSSLRSSRAALVEHLVGTHQAIERLSISRFKNQTQQVMYWDSWEESPGVHRRTDWGSHCQIGWRTRLPTKQPVSVMRLPTGRFWTLSCG